MLEDVPPELPVGFGVEVEQLNDLPGELDTPDSARGDEVPISHRPRVTVASTLLIPGDEAAEIRLAVAGVLPALDHPQLGHGDGGATDGRYRHSRRVEGLDHPGEFRPGLPLLPHVASRQNQ